MEEEEDANLTPNLNLKKKQVKLKVGGASMTFMKVLDELQNGE